MPIEVNYLVSRAATRKQKNAGSAGHTAEIVSLDDFRQRESWRRLGDVVRDVICDVIVTEHPAKTRLGR